MADATKELSRFDKLIGLLPVDAATFIIEVEGANGSLNSFRGMDLKWLTDNRITFLDLNHKTVTTISSRYIRVQEVRS